MANYDVQLILRNANGLAADDFVNTLHFEINAPDTLEGTADGIAAIWQGKVNFFSQIIEGLTVKVYEAGAGPPALVKDYTFSGGNGATPSEVACCLSYYADDDVTTAPRRRGRIYLGPFNAVSGERMDATLVDFVLDIGEALAQVGTAGNTTWLMKSVTNNAYYKIERIACDNAWDTQRRRGAAPTLRDFRDVQ
jgi:hypothetical protein